MFGKEQVPGCQTGDQMTDAVQTDQDIVTKGEFAKIMQVTPGRVSQWFGTEWWPETAFVGEGRRAKIRVSVARDAILRNINVGQAMGNGQATVKAALDIPTAQPSTAPQVFDEMAAAKLRKAEADAEAAEIALAQKRAELMPTVLVQQAMGEAGAKIARALDELQTKAAEIYAIAQNGGEADVRRFLRGFGRDVRNQVADAIKLTAGGDDV